MSDPLSLPEIDQRFFRKAMNELTHHKIDEAIKLLEESYQHHPSSQVLLELIPLYHQKHEKEQTMALWQDYNERFPIENHSQSLLLLYCESLTTFEKNTSTLLKLYQIKAWASNEFADTNWLVDLIVSLEEHLGLEAEIKSALVNNQLQDQVDRWQTIPPLELLHILKKVYTMDSSVKDPVLLSLLKTPKILQFIKSDILHHYLFQQRNLQLPVFINWIDQERVVNPLHLKSYKESSAYQKITIELEDYTNQNNPHLLDPLTEELNLITMIFFPYIDEAMSEPNVWLDYLLHHYQIEEALPNHLKKESYTLFQYAINEISQLSRF